MALSASTRQAVRDLRSIGAHLGRELGPTPGPDLGEDDDLLAPQDAAVVARLRRDDGKPMSVVRTLFLAPLVPYVAPFGSVVVVPVRGG